MVDCVRRVLLSREHSLTVYLLERRSTGNDLDSQREATDTSQSRDLRVILRISAADLFVALLFTQALRAMLAIVAINCSPNDNAK